MTPCHHISFYICARCGSLKLCVLMDTAMDCFVTEKITLYWGVGMTGSLQVKKGRFYAVLNFKDDEGKRKIKWFATGFQERGNRRRAQAFLNELLIKYQEYEIQKEERSFCEYILAWLTLEKAKIEKSTWESYECYACKHIVPFFEPLGLSLNEVTAQHIKGYYEYKASNGRLDRKAGGLSQASLKNHSKVIRQVLASAVMEELVSRNVAEHVPVPRCTKDNATGRGVYLNAEEANMVLRAFQGHRLQSMIYTTLYYGLRRSEVLGLKWDAIDLENNYMSIKHVIVKTKTIEARDRMKTEASRATYDLLPEVRELYIRIKKKQEYFEKLYGERYINSGYIFCWDNGKPYRPDYITRAFQSQLVKSGLTKMRFHDLRHSCAGILYDKGWGLKDIQEWLRHADIETTGNIYTHISQARKKILSHNLENTFEL